MMDAGFDGFVELISTNLVLICLTKIAGRVVSTLSDRAVFRHWIVRSVALPISIARAPALALTLADFNKGFEGVWPSTYE